MVCTRCSGPTSRLNVSNDKTRGNGPLSLNGGFKEVNNLLLQLDKTVCEIGEVKGRNER